MTSRPIFTGVFSIDPRDLESVSGVLRSECTPETWEKFEQSISLAAPLVFEVSVLEASKGRWRLRVSYRGVRYLVCSRSSENFESPVEGSLDVLVERNGSVQDYELRDDLDDEMWWVNIGPSCVSFDLGECVRQDIMLNEPARPVANPDQEFVWVDPNEVVEAQAEDPRWALLKEWKKRNPSSAGDESGST